ncbi:dTDP-4-dehydrorhamnose 3,5-epimerase family protein [Acinetobacter sp.]|uniref:dTDP-4-dehydrorhamnose 3,5-epimerase family protein n=1 Tax=Acinetobacter sp. TaxID=472 RepID=UPI000C57D57B|nr:dTDP-4-dehydrorhamnose 3,5-epimerase family protein [Acinetobacter sp.]MBC70332.1 dTDP-4-dehydrorhamnose 3,5-epimerase [Acinetobacter sp.]|tara:strand:- start:569 stop:1078 length:510 start_codon:yes stop_codon:yes gene_type:complete
MKVKKTNLDGVLEIQLNNFEDFRGEYIESYNLKEYAKNKINIEFIQDDFSISRKNVLRGIHGDHETWKLVSCIYGSFLLVVVNNDPDHKQYKEHFSIELNDKKRNQILIPPKFGNGHLVLSELAIFHYKQNTYYNPKGQFTLLWNDKSLKINWPIDNPILSERDSKGHF